MNSGSKMGLLTMCAKAGKLKMGMDMVKDACKTGTAKAAFVASDFSSKSLKEIKFFCGKYNVKLYALAVSMDEISQGIGKRTGVLAITDSGFAKACADGLCEIQTDRF